jgi:hypothetical protein
MTSMIIGTRRIDDEHPLRFAQASGDWNPIHVDRVAARRLLAGGIVIHGTSTLLWMLEQHLATGGQVPRSLMAAFPRPLMPGDDVTLTREQESEGRQRIAALLESGEVSSVSLALDGGARISGAPPQGLPARSAPADNSFVELKHASGVLQVQGLEARDRTDYPHIHERLGPLPIAGLMAVSRIVGMHCPGLHSLIASIELSFDPGGRSDAIEWRVVRHSVPHAPVRVAFKGSGLEGHVDAFVRPAPVTQESYHSLASRVSRQEFAAQTALVIGGSRGLGELAAKLIAAGGGDVIITHREGHDDAQRVAEEIHAGGGRCRIARFASEHARKDVESIVSALACPTHVYYFAAPRIGRAKSKVFSASTSRSFMDVFVDGFGQVAAGLAAVATGKVRLFYPSTVFLDEMPRDQGEYIAAKAAGEALCEHLNKHSDKLTVLVQRLPRLRTDQSAGLLSQGAQNPTPAVIDIVRAMNNLQSEKPLP